MHVVDRFSDTATGDVDYVAMKDSLEWAAVRAVAAELAHPRLLGELLAMTDNHKKAFLINLYNAMAFHGIVAFGRRSSPWHLYCFFIAPAVSYCVAGAQISLDDIENGMLRSQPGYFEEPMKKGRFRRRHARSPADYELQRGLRPKAMDPRIHMALNCGARGCPAVGVYSGASLEEDLDAAAAAFVADDGNVGVQPQGTGGISVSMSELFKVYLSDFAGDGAKPGSAASQLGALRWVSTFAKGRKRELLATALAPGCAHLNFTWKAYDWSTNGPDMPLDDRIYKPTL